MSSMTKAAILEMASAYAAVSLDEPTLHLAKQAFLPSLEISASDLGAIEADFPGYAPQTLGEFPAGWSAIQWATELSSARTVSTTSATFSRGAGGDPQTIYGWWLASAGDGSVVACGLFPTPLAVDVEDDSLALLPVVSLPIASEIPYAEN